MKHFQLRGINHLAIVCKDMIRTVDFYCNILGLESIETIELFFYPDGILLEFAATVRELGDPELGLIHAPKN